MREADKFGKQRKGNTKGSRKVNPLDHFGRNTVERILFCIIIPSELDEKKVFIPFRFNFKEIVLSVDAYRVV